MALWPEPPLSTGRLGGVKQVLCTLCGLRRPYPVSKGAQKINHPSRNYGLNWGE